MSSKLKQKAAKAAAAATSGPGTYTKQQLLELSVVNEEKIRKLLQDLQLCQPPVPANSAAAGLTNKQLQQHYAQLYDRLLEYGFQQQQVQVALAALPKGAADVAACLDWLCYNLPAQQLPRRFRGGSRLAAGAEGVKLVARAAEGTDPASAWDDNDSNESTSSKEDDKYAQRDDEQLAAAAVEPSADDREAAKAWILQQYMAESSEEEGDGPGSSRDDQQQQQQDDEVIEDWELWGDPREIERRRAERAFAALPPQQQRAKLAAEFAAARGWAAAAKAAGDKQKQKEAGQLIGQLKSEMQRLGMSESEVMGSSQQQQQQDKASRTNQGQKPQQQQQKEQDGKGEQQEDKDAEQGSASDEDAATAAAAAAAAEKARRKKKKEAEKQKAAEAAAAAAAEHAAAATKKKQKAKDKSIDKVKEYKEAKSKKKSEKEPKHGTSSGSSSKKSKPEKDKSSKGSKSSKSLAGGAASEGVAPSAGEGEAEGDWALDVAPQPAAAAGAADDSAETQQQQQQQQQQRQQLAEELEALGLQEEVQAAAADESEAAVAADATGMPAAAASAGQGEQQQQQHEDSGSEYVGVKAAQAAAAAAGGGVKPSSVSLEQQQQQQQDGDGVAPVKAPNKDDEDDWQPPDIFGEAAAAMDDGSAAAAAAPALKQPTPFTPWGQYSSSTGKASKLKPKHSKQQQPPPVEYKTPKALLQQHCQKVNLQPPRFERITQPAGVDAAAAAAAGAAAAGQRGPYRYKVILAPAVPVGGKGSAGAAAGSSKRFSGVLTGPKIYQLFADEDGWSSVQDAQNAAAARALFALHKQAVAAAATGKGSSSSQLMQMQLVYQQLEQQWAGLWDAWWGLEVSGGQGSGAGVEEVFAAEQEQQRDDFLRSLLVEQQQQGVQAVDGSTAVSPGQADAAFADEAGTTAAAESADNAESADVSQAVADDAVESDDAESAAAASDGGELVTHGEEAEEWLLAAGLDEEEPAAAAEQAAAAAAAEEQQLQAMQQQQRQRQQQAATARRNEQLQQQLLSWRSSLEGAAMQQQRAKLPMAALRQQIAGALAGSDAVVISGETGSGKTTQVPQFLLEDAVLSGSGSSCSIIVTQPRRIAAISVADRVAVERGEKGGPGAPGSSVGYHVRLDAAVSNSTQLLFCTTGILLRRLASDPLLSGVTHVVVDEVHERSLQGDVLMALLQRIAAARNAAADAAGNKLGNSSAAGDHVPQRLRVVLMSATLDANIYSSYYWGCPVLSCPGRTFPVTVRYLEDCYAETRYVLAPDARAALRPGSSAAAAAAAKRKASARGDAGRAALLSAGWGDEEALQTSALNPNYDPEVYAQYPERVRKNLARLNEDVLDLDFIEELISWADEETPLPGAILVFLPGMGEISALMERLGSSSRYNRGKHWLLPLHSAISADQQRAAFKVPPAGTRKIVLSTNIAETSVTLEDVVVVIDGGRHKERRFDPHKRMSLLVEDWVSKAAAMQRRGRAGRVRAGTCFCCYTRQRFEHSMRQYAVPEVARVPLEELVLQIHLLGLGPAASFLRCLIQPPPPKAVEAALAALQEVGALTLLPASADSAAAAAAAAAGGDSTSEQSMASLASTSVPLAARGWDAGDAEDFHPAAAAAAAGGVEVLTPLGRLLAVLPLEPRLGKLLVMGAALGCLAPALTIAAAFSHKSPFSAPLEKQDELERIRRAFAAPAAAPTGAAAAAGAPAAAGSSGASAALQGLLGDAAVGGKPLPAAAVAAAGLAAGQQSDHLLLVAAFEMWRLTGAAAGERAAAQVARRHMLSQQALDAMLELRRQFATLLQEAHLLPQQQQQQYGKPSSHSSSSSSKWACWADDPAHPANRFAGRPEVLKAALVAALVPHVAVMVASGAESRPGWLDGRGQQVHLHPSSVLHELTAGQLQQPHVVYLEKTKTSRVFLREVSVASPLALLLLGGSAFTVQHEAGTVLLDGWLQIRVPAATAVLIKRLRQALEQVLAATVAVSAGGGGGRQQQQQQQGHGLLGRESMAVMGLVQQLLAAELVEAGR